ncbi:MAG: phosphatidylserine decarboxylase family protein [Prevotellaceae bacterium]|jgi:phosphatidylserine decarboxylase|nr:phosphatidylserine decarboxylase family protein [Prevotellaceae bacterium]
MKIHKEGYAVISIVLLIVAIGNGLAAIYAGFGWGCGVGAVASVLLWLFICWFFRVPSRVPVLGDKAVLSAADGTVVLIDETEEPEYLKTRCIRVSVFMSIFDMHANFYPIGGTVDYYCYHAGKHLIAWYPKSSEKNEHTTIVVSQGAHKILFRQIAGLIARRIVCYAKEGGHVRQGGETGFIKFGSRVDIFLPLDATVKVQCGDKVKATQTIIAELR